jgi:NADPH:quinone reductase
VGAAQRAIRDLIDQTDGPGSMVDESQEIAWMSDASGPLTCDAWVVTKLGDPTAVLQRQVVEVPAPEPNEIRVAVEAFSLNFNDIDVIRGRYLTLPLEAPFVPGRESVGVVESAGAATAFGIPASMSSVDGAAMHYPFHLGWFALHERARLEPGETLLVHAGAGGTGSGAIQIGKALGAMVIATAGTDEKVEYCKGPGARWGSTGRDAPKGSLPTRRSWTSSERGPSGPRSGAS